MSTTTTCIFSFTEHQPVWRGGFAAYRVADPVHSGVNCPVLKDPVPT